MAVVEYKAHGQVAEIVLNRPERLNALNEELLFALKDALFLFDDDPDVRVAVLRGAGRAFCSGADVKDLQLRPPEEIERLGGVQPRGAQIRDLMFRFTNWKPIIAAVHGYALGGGLHIALLCDIVVAEEGCIFQVAETARGSDPSVLWSIIRARSSETFATEVSLTARRWIAEEGHRAGLIGRLAPTGQLEDTAIELAEEIGGHPSDAIRALVRRRRSLVELVEVEAQAARDTRLHSSPEFRKSAEAFLEGGDAR